MDDQAPEVETPDTTEDVVTDEPTQPVVDWEKRYNDLRPEFDRTNQEAAQYRRLIEGLNSDDLDTRREAAEALGIEFVDQDDTPEIEEEDDLYIDPVARRRLEAIEARIAQEEAERQQAADEAAEQARVDEAMAKVNEQITALGRDDATAEAIFAFALTLPHTPEGLPDIQAANEKFTAFENRLKESWATSKRGAAHVSPVGTSGTQVPDLDDPEQRVAWMASRLANSD